MYSRICYSPDGGGAGGQAGGQTSGQAGGQAGGQAAGEAGQTGGQATGQQTGQQTGQDWISGIADSGVRDWVTAKGFKDPGALAQSAHHLEKLTGDLNSIIRLPKDDKPESWGPVYDRLGRPKTPDEYKLPIPQGDSGEFAKTVSSWMHEAGLNPRQAQALAMKWNEHVAGLKTANTKAISDRIAAETQALKTEWGADFEANMALVDRAAVAFGLNVDTLTKIRDALGTAAASKLLHNIGMKLGVDDTFVAGSNEGGGGFMSAERARAEIAQLQKDRAFIEQFDSKDPKVRFDARERMDKLHRMAYPS